MKHCSTDTLTDKWVQHPFVLLYNLELSLKLATMDTHTGINLHPRNGGSNSTPGWPTPTLDLGQWPQVYSSSFKLVSVGPLTVHYWRCSQPHCTDLRLLVVPTPSVVFDLLRSWRRGDCGSLFRVGPVVEVEAKDRRSWLSYLQITNSTVIHRETMSSGSFDCKSYRLPISSPSIFNSTAGYKPHLNSVCRMIHTGRFLILLLFNNVGFSLGS